MVNNYALFKKDNLKFYQIVKEPCTAVVTVANTVKLDYLIEDGSASRFIVNLKVATAEGFKNCLKVLNSRSACPFSDVASHFLSGALWASDIIDNEQLPTKGEKIIATFEIKEELLRCVALTMIPRKNLEKFNYAAHCATRSLYEDLIKQK